MLGLPGPATDGDPDEQAFRHPSSPSSRPRPGGPRNLLPLPGSLRGGAASKVVTALLGRGLVRE